jgi:type IV pilus assembly protein PilY1
MSSISRRLGLGLMLLGAAGPAFAQQVAPPNIHFLVDTSGSMRELPQIKNSSHSTFFNSTTSGCFNPQLDAMAVSRGWNPDTAYPVADVGTGLGSDTGFPDLFRDDKFYAYMYWNDSTSPVWQWDSKEQACQSQVPSWNSTRVNDYNRCVSCLSLKGYYKLPEATSRDVAPLQNLDFIFWGRFLNFNPPKYVTAKAVLKQVIKDLQNTRAGISVFTTSGVLTSMLKAQNPSCSVALNDASGFDTQRASYINAVNGLTFTTGTPLAKSLLNVGYYFTSDDSVYQTSFNFGTNYTYPAAFKNAALTSDNRSVCWGCQTNAVIILTDGEPSGDTFTPTMADRVRVVNGGPTYCPDSQPCGGGSAINRDMGSNLTSYLDDNANYYLDDVAKLLYQQDLQRNTPDVVGDFDTYGKQSVITYTVGFGIDSNLLKNTAAVGGGLSFSADNAPALKQALQTIVSDVQTRAQSCIYTPPPAP